jgi:hypothetical protein
VVVVAILLAVAILAGFVLLRATSPMTVPSGPPPAGVNLFYVYDPHNSADLDAYDWTGTPRGMVPIPHELALHRGGGLWASPNGSSFVLVHGDASAQWLDRLGKPVAADPLPDFLSASYMWSADSRGVCGLRVSDTSMWEISTVTPSGQARIVATIPASPDLRPALYLVACSFADDRVLLRRWQSSTPQQQNDLVSVTLSTGSLTLLSPAKTVGYVASPTGAVIAENSYGPDGGPVVHIHPLVSESSAVGLQVGVSMFSGDGTLVMAGTRSELELLDWRNDRVLWRFTGGFGSTVSYFGQPGGSKFVVASGPVPSCRGCSLPPQTVTILGRDGSRIRIPDSPHLVVPELPT